MNIQFKKVTWYSKLASIIFFLCIFPVLTFYLGIRYQEAMGLYTDTTVEAQDVGGTYTNAKYGFSFHRPAHVGIFSLDESSNFDLGTDTSSRLNLSVINFDALSKTIDEACVGQPVDDCYNSIARPWTKDEITAFANEINNKQIGQEVKIPNHKNWPFKGKIISLDNRRGVLDLELEPEASNGTAVTLYWVDASSNLLSLSRELPSDTVEGALKTNEYKSFLEIVSSFKFSK